MSHHDHESIRHDSSSRRLVIIADDLTGACDSAVAFAAVANPVRVHITPDFSVSSAVTLLSTNSRDLPANEAVERLAEVASKLPADCSVFKKIDSVFRGNTFTDIANSIELFPAELALLAPAYPAMGRRLRNGVLEVDGHGGTESIPILELLKQHGCAPRLVRASTNAEGLASEVSAALSNGTKLILCDATEKAELSAIVEAAESLRRRTLWIGSGGLAHAIAGRWPKQGPAAEPGLPAGEVVFFIGSDHPVTLEQQLHLERTSGIGRAGPADSRSRVVSVPRNNASEAVLRATRDMDERDAGCLFMTGGDTALATCRALGIASLRLQREFVPGVPMCIAEGGRFDGVTVILKSGGFGERDLLCRILDSFAGKDRAYA